jgi:hypothetical protein
MAALTKLDRLHWVGSTLPRFGKAAVGRNFSGWRAPWTKACLMLLLAGSIIRL